MDFIVCLLLRLWLYSPVTVLAYERLYYPEKNGYLNNRDIRHANSSYSDIVSDKYHVNCRNKKYPFRGVPPRIFVPDDMVPWNVSWEDYNPDMFTRIADKNVKHIDPINITELVPKWNEMDGLVNRKSVLGTYEIKDGYPLNPMGRTGFAGRGLLERWGPNPSINLVLTRWKLNKGNYPRLDPVTNLPLMQIVGFKSRFIENWSIPGKAMLPGTSLADSFRRLYYRLFVNLRSIHLSEQELLEVTESIRTFFRQRGTIIYKGYVDDSRNTDNAWVETIVKHFHCEIDDMIGKIPLKCTHSETGSTIKWVDFNNRLRWVKRHRELVANITLPGINYKTI